MSSSIRGLYPFCKITPARAWIHGGSLAAVCSVYHGVSTRVNTCNDDQILKICWPSSYIGHPKAAVVPQHHRTHWRWLQFCLGQSWTSTLPIQTRTGRENQVAENCLLPWYVHDSFLLYGSVWHYPFAVPQDVFHICSCASAPLSGTPEVAVGREQRSQICWFTEGGGGFISTGFLSNLLRVDESTSDCPQDSPSCLHHECCLPYVEHILGGRLSNSVTSFRRSTNKQARLGHEACN